MWSNLPLKELHVHVHAAHFYLEHGEIEEGGVIPDRDEALGSHTAHAGSQTAVQLQDDQLAQETLSHLFVGLRDGGIGPHLRLRENSQSPWQHRDKLVMAI